MTAPTWEPSDEEVAEARRFGSDGGGTVVTGWRCRCGSLDARVLTLEPPSSARVVCVACWCERLIRL